VRKYAAQVQREGTLANADAELARHFGAQLEARVLLAHGDTARALAVIERGWPVGTAGAAIPIFQGETYTHASERFLRAELLGATGRTSEALRWYDTVVEDLGFGIALEAPIALRRAALYERIGATARARSEYRRAIALWSGADRELQGIVDVARRREAHLGAIR
nr:hypothetical protein [Gemmatimonadales bacterium]